MPFWVPVDWAGARNRSPDTIAVPSMDAPGVAIVTLTCAATLTGSLTPAIPARASSTYALVAASVARVGVRRAVIFWLFMDTDADGAAIWSRRLVLTCVSKFETVAASWVPVWLALASGSVASLLSAIAAEPLTIESVIVPAGR